MLPSDKILFKIMVLHKLIFSLFSRMILIYEDVYEDFKLGSHSENDILLH